VTRTLNIPFLIQASTSAASRTRPAAQRRKRDAAMRRNWRAHARDAVQQDAARVKIFD